MALTSAQIVTSVCAMCKVPGFTSLAGQFLNQTLDDLQQHFDLKMNLVTASISLQTGIPGPFPLEADYLRTYDLFYLVGFEPYFLQQGSLREYDNEYQAPGYTGYPFEFATDLSATSSGGLAQLYVYPAPSVQTTLTHRYMQRHPDITLPESSPVIPWFIDQSYLLKKTAAWLMTITDDERQPQFEAMANEELKKHLIMEGDEQKVLRRVELDWRTFRVGNSNKSTKTMPF